MTPILIKTAAAGALAALLMFGGKKKPKTKPADEGRPPWLEPIWVPTGPNGDQPIRDRICELAPPGSLIVVPEILASLWAEFWPGVPWPILPGDHATAQTAAQLLEDLVDDYLAAPEAFCGDDGGLPDVEPDSGPFPIHEFEDVYPNDGYMYQVVYGDYLGGTNSTHSIAYRALLSAGFKAAKGPLKLDDAAAGVFARALAKNAQARAIYIRMIQCDVFNDMFYGTAGYDQDKTSGGPHGRGLRLLPMHADNRSRLAQSLPPLRVIDIVSGKGNGGNLEYLHLPLLDPARVANAALSIDDRLAPGEWPDGTPGVYPPPAIAGLISTAVLPKKTYGCAPHTVTV